MNTCKRALYQRDYRERVKRVRELLANDSSDDDLFNTHPACPSIVREYGIEENGALPSTPSRSAEGAVTEKCIRHVADEKCLVTSLTASYIKIVLIVKLKALKGSI